LNTSGEEGLVVMFVEFLANYVPWKRCSNTNDHGPTLTLTTRRGRVHARG